MSNNIDSSTNDMQYRPYKPYTPVTPPNVQYTPYKPVEPPKYNQQDVTPTVVQPSGVTPNQAYQVNVQQQQQQQQPPPASVVMGNQVQVERYPTITRYPCTLICPECNNKITTHTKHKASTMAYFLCCLTCIWCFLCIDCLKDVHHECPKCGHKVAIVH